MSKEKKVRKKRKKIVITDTQKQIVLDVFRMNPNNLIKDISEKTGVPIYYVNKIIDERYCRT